MSETESAPTIELETTVKVSRDELVDALNDRIQKAAGDVVVPIAVAESIAGILIDYGIIANGLVQEHKVEGNIDAAVEMYRAIANYTRWCHASRTSTNQLRRIKEARERLFHLSDDPPGEVAEHEDVSVLMEVLYDTLKDWEDGRFDQLKEKVGTLSADTSAIYINIRDHLGA